MATQTWINFVHSWHTLGIVLKWMCITVIGIPVAIATCLVVALAALAFFALVILAALGSLALVYFIIKGAVRLTMLAPEAIAEWRRKRNSKKLLPLSERQPIPLHEPWNIGRISRREARQRQQPAQPIQLVPAGYYLSEDVLQAPEEVHLAEEKREPSESAVPISDIAGSNKITCCVCLEEKLETEYPARLPTSTCDHNITDCCSDCLSQSIKMAFEGNIWTNIRCPVCNEQLDHQDMREFAPNEIFEKYDKLSMRQALERDLPNFRWCIGPNCSFGQEHPEDLLSQPILTCSACSFVSCARHNVGWHNRETCDEYEKRVRKGMAGASKKSEKVIAKISKKCPKCQRAINKNGGCMHMTCVCGLEFCWHCLHSYPGHTWGCSRRGVH
ncbi:hypothetical protein B0J14DRAFT_249408 [Halenospora varia]|nr:hypothetical protein B0J14DRAFT_249408 [Halenospora varia]